MDAIAIPPVVPMETNGMALAPVLAMTVLAGTAMGIFLCRRRRDAQSNREDVKLRNSLTSTVQCGGWFSWSALSSRH